MPKGMILAAGIGERLRPLTNWLPKPLLPVANTPVMLQGIRRLKAVGVTDICVNVSYRAGDIQLALGDGSELGVSLHWSVEKELLGTAGGMRRVADILRDDLIVVIAGDAMLDIDLAPLIEFHRRNNATATIGAIPVEDTSQYGVVETFDDYRIKQFQEKPSAGTQISNNANTGIYVFDCGILDIIPPDERYDFARDVFPRLLADGQPFYACPVSGYWTDIGSPRAYLQANLDFLSGRIGVEGDGERVGDNFLGRNVQVDGTNLHNCVVGQDAVIPTDSDLSDCVVWPGAKPPEPVKLKSAIVTPYGTHVVE